MARHEADREDLVKEATAYVIRGELLIPDWEQPLFIGFRKTGAFSFYFGPDPVYQFDPQARLRRAFVAGKLYRSQGHILCSMYRHRTETETALMRTDLTIEQTHFFQWGMHEAIRQLNEAVNAKRYQIRKVVGDRDLWLEKIEQSTKHVLAAKEFLAPKLVSRPCSV